MKKKLLLVNPVTPGKAQFQGHKYSTYQPIGLGIVAALTPDHWEVDLIDENFESYGYREADLVGISAYTPSANRAYEIAMFYSAKGIPTVMGGIHASMLPQEALRFVDTVVIGEAESTWAKVISDFESGNMQDVYRGELLSMAGAPRPRRDLFNSRYNLASIQTTRGCPMDCDFCSVSVFNGRQYRCRPVEEVLDELEEIPQKRIFFVDDNLVGNGKENEERAISLFKGMMERGIKKSWFSQASLNVARNEEVLYYAARSGCRMLLIGIEAEKKCPLDNLSKKMNLKILHRYNEMFKLINKYGIAILGGFIFGTDADRIEDLHARAQFINKSRIDVIQPTILTPYPGTTLYKKLAESGRLLYTNYPGDWDKYDMSEALFKPLQMSQQELKAAMARCYQFLLNGGNLLNKFIKTIIFTRSLPAALWAFYTNRIYRSMAMRKIREWKCVRGECAVKAQSVGQEGTSSGKENK